MFCSTTSFEGVKQIIENIYIQYSESIRAREKESRRNHVIYTQLSSIEE